MEVEDVEDLFGVPSPDLDAQGEGGGEAEAAQSPSLPSLHRSRGDEDRQNDSGDLEPEGSDFGEPPEPPLCPPSEDGDHTFGQQQQQQEEPPPLFGPSEEDSEATESDSGENSDPSSPVARQRSDARAESSGAGKETDKGSERGTDRGREKEGTGDGEEQRDHDKEEREKEKERNTEKETDGRGRRLRQRKQRAAEAPQNPSSSSSSSASSSSSSSSSATSPASPRKSAEKLVWIQYQRDERGERLPIIPAALVDIDKVGQQDKETESRSAEEPYSYSYRKLDSKEWAANASVYLFGYRKYVKEKDCVTIQEFDPINKPEEYRQFADILRNEAPQPKWQKHPSFHVTLAEALRAFHTDFACIVCGSTDDSEDNKIVVCQGELPQDKPRFLKPEDLILNDTGCQAGFHVSCGGENTDEDFLCAVCITRGDDKYNAYELAEYTPEQRALWFNPLTEVHCQGHSRHTWGRRGRAQGPNGNLHQTPASPPSSRGKGKRGGASGGGLALSSSSSSGRARAKAKARGGRGRGRGIGSEELASLGLLRLGGGRGRGGRGGSGRGRGGLDLYGGQAERAPYSGTSVEDRRRGRRMKREMQEAFYSRGGGGAAAAGMREEGEEDEEDDEEDEDSPLSERLASGKRSRSSAFPSRQHSETALGDGGDAWGDSFLAGVSLHKRQRQGGGSLESDGDGMGMAGERGGPLDFQVPHEPFSQEGGLLQTDTQTHHLGGGLQVPIKIEPEEGEHERGGIQGGTFPLKGVAPMEFEYEEEEEEEECMFGIPLEEEEQQEIQRAEKETEGDGAREVADRPPEMSPGPRPPPPPPVVPSPFPVPAPPPPPAHIRAEREGQTGNNEVPTQSDLSASPLPSNPPSSSSSSSHVFSADSLSRGADGLPFSPKAPAPPPPPATSAPQPSHSLQQNGDNPPPPAAAERETEGQASGAPTQPAAQSQAQPPQSDLHLNAPPPGQSASANAEPTQTAAPVLNQQHTVSPSPVVPLRQSLPGSSHFAPPQTVPAPPRAPAGFAAKSSSVSFSALAAASSHSSGSGGEGWRGGLIRKVSGGLVRQASGVTLAGGGDAVTEGPAARVQTAGAAVQQGVLGGRDAGSVQQQQQQQQIRGPTPSPRPPPPPAASAAAAGRNDQHAILVQAVPDSVTCEAVSEKLRGRRQNDPNSSTIRDFQRRLVSSMRDGERQALFEELLLRGINEIKMARGATQNVSSASFTAAVARAATGYIGIPKIISSSSSSSQVPQPLPPRPLPKAIPQRPQRLPAPLQSAKAKAPTNPPPSSTRVRAPGRPRGYPISLPEFQQKTGSVINTPPATLRPRLVQPSNGPPSTSVSSTQPQQQQQQLRRPPPAGKQATGQAVGGTGMLGITSIVRPLFASHIVRGAARPAPQAPLPTPLNPPAAATKAPSAGASSGASSSSSSSQVPARPDQSARPPAPMQVTPGTSQQTSNPSHHQSKAPNPVVASVPPQIMQSLASMSADILRQHGVFLNIAPIPSPNGGSALTQMPPHLEMLRKSIGPSSPQQTQTQPQQQQQKHPPPSASAATLGQGQAQRQGSSFQSPPVGNSSASQPVSVSTQRQPQQQQAVGGSLFVRGSHKHMQCSGALLPSAFGCPPRSPKPKQKTNGAAAPASAPSSPPPQQQQQQQERPPSAQPPPYTHARVLEEQQQHRSPSPLPQRERDATAQESQQSALQRRNLEVAAQIEKERHRAQQHVVRGQRPPPNGTVSGTHRGNGPSFTVTSANGLRMQQQPDPLSTQLHGRARERDPHTDMIQNPRPNGLSIPSLFPPRSPPPVSSSASSASASASGVQRSRSPELPKAASVFSFSRSGSQTQIMSTLDSPPPPRQQQQQQPAEGQEGEGDQERAMERAGSHLTSPLDPNSSPVRVRIGMAGPAPPSSDSGTTVSVDDEAERETERPSSPGLPPQQQERPDGLS
uniref:Uncharacterized protein n=1 Tax=Chromera velia CCMP2878 TaxID=1169474 RepID=A0A0G4FX84_9ALVE|eukprot:Cvel_3827.t1-p1 / transcript=Cvel_3827.t1 / gene=Cvel_3827 / organism=Chromera_velia_CCMP2878 / gene_product=hypothetical protein / transcript_product=hypothetical protein / location=Cvel_scaffold161:115768-123803(-) / protein_length=1928 / sequence_SO=supercontig / SO=protein_coding / is_pseudo=false